MMAAGIDAGPAKARSPAATVSVVLLAVDLFLIALLAASVGLGLGRLRAFLADLSVQLPALTQQILSLPVGAHLGFLALLAVGLVVKELLIPLPRLRLAVNLAMLFLTILMGLVCGVALLLPLLSLMQPLQTTLPAGGA